MNEVQQAAISAAQSWYRRMIGCLADADRNHEYPSLREEYTIDEVTKLYIHYGGKV